MKTKKVVAKSVIVVMGGALVATPLYSKINEDNYMKKIFFILILLIINSCNKENPVENRINEDVAKDTLNREIIDNVFLFVDSLKDLYTFDEYIYANVHLKNENNSSGLPIFIGSYPPFLSWRFKNSKGEFVDGGPLIIGASEYNDTLKIGEEIIDNIKWFQNIYDENEMSSGLKAFMGDYIFEINFRGIKYENYPHLIKYFKISEVGDPLSYHLFRDYDSEDTIKIDFVLRNRINNQIQLNATTDSCGIYIVKENNNQTDTVYTNKFLLEQSVYNLAPLLDNVLYKFRYSEKDFINQGIKGAFNIIIKLNFKERIIISSNLLFIL